jgi:hypothetical protein
MFYKLLGMAVWRAGTYYVKNRYGGLPPTPVLLGLGAAAAGAIALAALAKRNGSPVT